MNIRLACFHAFAIFAVESVEQPVIFGESMSNQDEKKAGDYGVKMMNPNDILIKPVQASRLLSLTGKTLRNIEEESDLDIERINQGAVSARAYRPSDLFDISAVRRKKGNLKGLPETAIVSVYVQKGGTGKTTTSVNLAISLGLQGLKVCILDNDPQGDTSTMLGYDPDLTSDELEELGIDPDRAIESHLGNLMQFSAMFQAMALDQVVKKPFGDNGPHLIPADDSLNDMDVALRAASGADFRYALFFEKAIKGEIPGCDLSQYDVIIIDNAPSSSMLSTNAMIAADMVICPIRMDKFSVKALSRLQRRMLEIEEDFNRSSDIVAVPTMFIRNRPRAQMNLAKVSEAFEGQVSDTLLYHSEDYTKSLEEGVPLYFWRQANENSQGALRDLGKEIHQRLIRLMSEEG